MTNLKRTSLKARLAWLLAVVIGAALTPLAVRAAAMTGDVMFGDAKISVVNAETNWVDGDLLLVWTNKANRTGSFTLPGLAEARFLVIGGGGAGGSMAPAENTKSGGAGGGGAGGYLALGTQRIARGKYDISVGKGGQNAETIDVSTQGAKGGDTTIATNGHVFAMAEGGGGGGARGNGGDGGSGGGGSLVFVSGRNYNQGIGGKGSQGHDGGTTEATRPAGYGGGGGGAGEAAGKVIAGSNPGGDGLQNDITGPMTYYAGGGGGGGISSTGEKNHPGGLGGGGAGGVATMANYLAQPGADGYGGGGGGGGYGDRNRGADGGCGGVYVRISAALGGPVKPPPSQEIVYDGEEHVFIPKSIAYYVASGPTSGKNVDEYVATLALNTDFSWEDGEPKPTGTRTVTLKINPAKAEIKNLVQKGWVKDTPAEDTPDPTCTVNLCGPGEPTYDYCTEEGSDYSPDKPTAVGTYYVRATVKDDPAGNYLGAVAYAKFAIYEDPAKIFTDYVEITNVVYTGSSPKELTNFPYKVTLAKDNPLGFTYERAGTSGEDICFMDADGNLLPYEIGDWNVKGESVLYVRVPLITATPRTIRLYWKPREGSSVPAYDPSSVWADWPNRSAYDAAAAKVAAPKFDDVRQDGRIVNYWKVYPSMNWTEWNAGDPAGSVTNKGQLAHGVVAMTVINSLTGETLDKLPTDVGGVYRLSFNSAEPEKYNTPEYHIDVRIVEHDPMSDLKGDAASLTLSGRVLLANDDTVSGHVVTSQGYWQVETVKSGRNTYHYNPFWVHEGTHAAFANLQDGVNHTLWYTNTVDGVLKQTAIWTLQDVMIGSTATAETLSGTTYCYLPYSPTSKMISSYANRTKAATRVEAGTLVMRNAEGAAIYSQCYTNGIGTVYFDAVNTGRYQGNDYYHVAVEVATETVDGKEPTDENAAGDLAWNLKWRRCPILPLMRDNNATFFTALAETNDVMLAITTGGTDKNFYRLCAKVETRGVARFRIVRTKHSPGALIDAGTCMITLDNVIVSYPRNTAHVEPYGHYDDTLKGRTIVGYGNATMTPFPSITDAGIHARTKADVFMGGLTNADPSTFIQLSRLHYRWRYLNQSFEPWRTVDLRPVDNYIAEEPLDLPRAVGDVEYWFETFTQMPYYEFFDYSGKGYGLKGKSGEPLYSEEMAIVTNTLDLATVDGFLPGNNTNWFFRVRYGRSDLERIRLVVKRGEGAALEFYDMELTADNEWRVYVRTPEALADGVQVRFEAVNRQTPGDELYATNLVHYILREDVTSAEKPNALEPAADSNAWSRVACDAETGGLMFQVQDASKAVAVVHADYQNFNAWSDANKKAELFVGKYEYNEAGASGSNPETRTYEDLFKTWHLSNAANTNYWSEPFNVDVEQMAEGKDYEPFKPFTGSRRTPNGLTTGPGQWVTGRYRAVDKDIGLALQMQGQGKGYLQFVDAAVSPRGLESVSFKARLGQALTFNDFSYWMGGLRSDYTNYTFVTRAAYDLKSRTDFAGNASLSVVAFYQPGVGAYELRVEQENANAAKTGPGGTQRLSLYRWRYNSAKGGVLATRLGTMTVNNDAALKTDGENGNYGALFIDVQSTAKKGGVTYVRAGITRNCQRAGNTDAADATWVWYNDTDDDLRLKWGTYGVLCANCPGRFVTPMAYDNTRSSTCPANTTDVGFKSSASGTNFTFPDYTRQRNCYDELVTDEAWAVMPWRMEVFGDSAFNYGLRSDPVPQEINVYTAPAGSTDWKLVATTNVVSFGSMTPIVLDFWSKDDCSVKIAPGGDDDTARLDVVIDDFEIRQWRGESYDDAEGTKYFENVRYGSPTNVVFTQAWILTNSYGVTNCQLSAKRSQRDVATSVRSPLMDGIDGRGLGLGMVTFTYANAQPNVNLLVQVCTNGIDVTSLPTISKSADGEYWRTVTNFSFAAFTDEQRKGGQLSHYFGLHGVAGAMRVVMDPAVVAAVENETDRSKFASIDLTGVVFRDEPELDETSWWGWNLRTTDDPLMMNISDVAAQGVENGMVLGLNNSITDKTLDADAAQYSKHFPFVQSPLFGKDIVGEVTFKARKYAAADPSARITLYGANGVTVPDDGWVRLTSWTISNATYQVYSYKTAPGENFRAFRFAVTGVTGVSDPKMPDPHPLVPACRILMDEVMVLEAVRTRVGFKNVAAFRNHLDTREAIADILDRSEQPLCKEAWGVQAEIFAAQLADEVDLSTAKVRLWWYEGLQPWGFEKWRERGQSAWLTACEGATNVFRSSYFGAPDAVMPAQQTPGTVQYMLEVQYRTNKGVVTTNWLEKADWQTPSWYNPVDYNVKYGEFSAFNILDTVSPGWAWINELNLYGEMDENYENTDKSLQFVEIAAPSDADLSGWTLRFLYANSGAKTITTNDVATFGTGALPGLKKDLKGLDTDSGCVFHVIGSPYVFRATAKPLTVADGTLDGVWSVKTSTSAVYTDGEIQRAMPIGVQLVRPSGVVAHELVAIGTNRWEYLGGDYLTETQVNEMNADERRNGGQGLFFDAGMDAQGIGTNAPWSTSLGAARNNGLTALDWTDAWGMTPGRRNEFQDIPGKPPKPLGTSIIVYSAIEGDHLWQTFADAARTNVTVAAVVTKGATTNITYFADRWYQVGAITTNGVAVAVPPDGTREFVLTVGGEGCSNDFTVVAHSAIDGRLERDYGLGPDNRYRLAVMDWLTKGATKRGAFRNLPRAADEPLVGLAEFHAWDGTFVTNLNLTTMYWLDMDPTWRAGDLCLRAGFTDKFEPVPAPEGLTDVRMTISMMITNRNEEAKAEKPWAPYILQGLTPGESSWDYAGGRGGWTSVTFKVTGILSKELVWDAPEANWLPLRWFVFQGGKIGGNVYSTSFDENYASKIEIIDPHSTASPGHSHRWDAYPDVPVWHRWAIDDRLQPVGVELLCPTNWYNWK